MTHSRILRTSVMVAPRARVLPATLPSAVGLLAAVLLAVPAAAQPILIPLSPQAREQPQAPPRPMPVPIAPPQADATDTATGGTDALSPQHGAASDAQGDQGAQETARTGQAEPLPTR